MSGIGESDQQCWDTLVDRHSAYVWRVARSVVNDNDLATDAMQTAWMRLLENVDKISNPAKVRSWLATTAKREAMALSRARSKSQPTDPHDWSFETATTTAEDPLDLTAVGEQNRTVISELRKLSNKCQQLLTMAAHSVAYLEISTTMDMPIGSIGPTMRRCLDKLRQAPSIAGLEAIA